MMTGTTKRKISGGEIVSDIRSGMSEAELKGKYGLCHNSLKQVLDKLYRGRALDGGRAKDVE